MRQALAVILLGVLPVTAAAQEEVPATQPQAEPEPEVVPEIVNPVAPGDEGPIPDPNVPDPNIPPESADAPPPYRYAKRDYPKELVKRPLTLAADQAEVSLEVPFVLGDGRPTLTQVLRGGFGVTVDLELGVTYAVGLERLNPAAGQDGFDVGKAFSVDAAYTIFPDWLAAQVRLAFYTDPDLFGLGLTLGLPFKIVLGDRWMIFGGADLVSIKLKSLAVYPADPGRNEAQAADVQRGVVAPSGSIDFTGGVAYQVQPALAVWGTVGLGWPDFDTNDQPFALFAGATYSPRRFWDVGGRIGFLALDEPAQSFSLGIFTALRM